MPPRTRRSGAPDDRARPLEDRLWASADLLRSNLDATEYKHVVLRLLFLRCADLRPELRAPERARWPAVVARAGEPGLAEALDAAGMALEAAHPALAGALPPLFVRVGLPDGALPALVRLIDTVHLDSGKEREIDLLGRVYEYFLGRFASSEGRGGGEFYTPAGVVRVLVELLEPFGGTVYDPCCGSGGMFVQSVQFVAARGGATGRIVGQESNPTTWRMARLNLALRGVAADLGPGPADTLARDQHPGLQADFILANPPFNISRWATPSPHDPRWAFGLPPPGNANFAWVQHMVHHLAPGGIAGVVLANGSLTSKNKDEAQIRAGVVRAGLVAAVVALPDQLFYSTPIPACVWILAKERADTAGRTLMIDARGLGRREDRAHRVLDPADVAKIATIWRRHRHGEDVAVPGFARSVATEALDPRSLAPGGYVGAAPTAAATGSEIGTLAASWRAARAEGEQIDARIAATLARMGW